MQVVREKIIKKLNKTPFKCVRYNDVNAITNNSVVKTKINVFGFRLTKLFKIKLWVKNSFNNIIRIQKITIK